MKVTVQVEGRTFEVEVMDLCARPVVAVVDGERFEIWPEETGRPTSVAEAGSVAQTAARPEPRAQPADPARAPGGAIAPRPSRRTSGAAPQPAAVALKTVYAPLPGVIDSIKVQPGDEVEAGQELCVLEAMKMKNVIRSSRAGEIARLHVSVGQHVKHNDALVEFLA